MESSLAMRLRSDERVIELKADFQIAVRLLQSQIRLWREKEIEKTERGMRKKLCRLAILKSKMISVEK